MKLHCARRFHGRKAISGHWRSRWRAIISIMISTHRWCRWRNFLPMQRCSARSGELGILLRMPAALGVHGLTTPVAYITRMPLDPLTTTPEKGKGITTFAYLRLLPPDWADEDALADPHQYSSWVLYSPGPDRDYDFNFDQYSLWEAIRKYDEAAEQEPTIQLSYKHPIFETVRYDPTNGSVSNGDVLRLSEGKLFDIKTKGRNKFNEGS